MSPTTNPWQSVLDRLQKILKVEDIKHWICHITFSSYENGELIVEVPNEFIRNWIVEHYLEAIESACRETLSDFSKLKIRTNKKLEVMQTEDVNEAKTTFAAEVEVQLQHIQKPRSWLIDRFVVGPENRVAHAVATSITEGLEKRPEWPIVYIHGACGIGKTHLLKGIAEKAQVKQCRQMYLSAETLVNELIAAIKEGTNEAFRRKFRSLRLLIVDDLDFMFEGNKVASRKEFLFIIDAITAGGGCVILCANKGPREMKNENDKLYSLLSSGLTIQVKAPENDTLEKIIAFRAKRKGLSILSQEMIAAIAKRCINVREAIGILNGLKLLTDVYKRPVDSEMLEEAWGHIGIKLPPALTIHRIQEAVAKHFRLDPKLLNGKGRTRKLTYPRQIAMSLCRELLPDKPLAEIAKAFGRDHTTVIYACEQIAKDLAAAPDLEAIRASLTRT